MPPALLAELAPFGRNGVLSQESLAPFTSFRIGGPAEALLIVRKLEHLTAALAVLWRWQTPFLLLGGASNVLISDAGVPGLTILNQCRRLTWPADNDPAPCLRAESGAPLAGLARSAIKRRLGGLAWAVSIPGAVGGAVVGNAGAHNGCLADNLQSAVLWENGRVQEVAAADLGFAYRRSRLKPLVARPGLGPVVLTATLRLWPDPDGVDASLAEGFIAHRRRTQPVDKSAGSIFKNPEGDYAGRLIEAAGLKGYAIGGASVSALHGNFIINQGGAVAADVLRLIDHIRQTVLDRFGILLEPEIQLIGNDDGRSTVAHQPSTNRPG
jgi:UDP-N-acetylmuramate dehydrogenase